MGWFIYIPMIHMHYITAIVDLRAISNSRYQNCGLIVDAVKLSCSIGVLRGGQGSLPPPPP